MADAFERFLDAEGVWCQALAPRGAARPALFLDRDGVVIEEVGHIARVEDMALIPGAAEVIAAANRLAVPVIIVTNQPGIAHGYFGWAEFVAIQEAMIAALGEAGARVDAVFAAPHHPQGRAPYGHPDHPARKPNAGMLLRAQAALGLDLKRSWLVGDKASDVAAARAAGLQGALHVLTGHGVGDRDEVGALVGGDFEVRLGASIRDALGLPLLQAPSETRAR